MRERDRELPAAGVCGDPRALERLYLNYARPLTAFVSRFVRGSAIAEEVINDTFMLVWRTAKVVPLPQPKCDRTAEFRWLGQR
jgi:DNA-directed RNA polymerase specialized sigma24 family protein